MLPTRSLQNKGRAGQAGLPVASASPCSPTPHRIQPHLLAIRSLCDRLALVVPVGAQDAGSCRRSGSTFFSPHRLPSGGGGTYQGGTAGRTRETATRPVSAHLQSTSRTPAAQLL